MTSCSWEFGFDMNCTETSLQAGFVKGSTVADSTGLLEDDTIVFHLFDITGGTGSGFAPIGALLVFNNGDDTESTQYPFSNSPGPASVGTGNAVIQLDSLGSSTLASSPYFSNGTAAAFPRWTMTGPLTINVDKGRFLLQVQVTLAGIEGGETVQKVYSIDPEMEVGSIG